MSTTKQPGLFETTRLLFAGVTQTTIKSLRLVEDATDTARLAVIPMQVDSLAEAQASLKDAGLDFNQFQDLKQSLLK